MIRLSNVNKYFFKGKQNEIHVINDISLELPQKGMVALFGQSGCGKTTLLNVIGGLDGIKSGSIEIDGKDIRKNTDDLRNRYIGYIFQNYNLNLKVTNYENVAESLRLCGMEDEETISERVYAALANVGMEKFANRMPDTLSGGQKQRIAIARAIVKNPAIILADEPTGNLDSHSSAEILEILKGLHDEGHTVIIITHDPTIAAKAERIIHIMDGEIYKDEKNEDGKRGENSIRDELDRARAEAAGNT
jgi:ABC-type lipoprotein export system ATPase subunit